jgi:PAS domain S-box-containing protein
LRTASDRFSQCRQDVVSSGLGSEGWIQLRLVQRSPIAGLASCASGEESVDEPLVGGAMSRGRSPAEPSALIDEAAHLGILLDRLPALIGYWGRDRRNVIANIAYLEWFGWTAEAMRGAHMRDVLGPSLYAKDLPHIRGALRGREQHFERTLTDTQERVRHTQASYIPHVVDNKVLGFFVLVADVTARVEAEHALAEAQRLAGLGSWVWDFATGEVTWSRALYELLGIDPANFHPTTDKYVAVVHPDDRAGVLARTRRAIEEVTDYGDQYRLLLPDGRVRYVESRGHVEHAVNGRAARLRGTVQDVTESRLAAQEMSRANKELAAANRLQADMIAMLGHDVRQPLTILLSLLEMILLDWDHETEEAKLADLTKAGNAARRLYAMIDDILALAVADNGHIPCQPEPIDVLRLLTELTTDTTCKPAPEPGPAVTAFADARHLASVLANLVSNAQKYGEPPLTITARTDNERVNIEVTDNGEGIPPEFVPHLFDRFSRATTGAARSQPGTGFGLYLARQLIEANHGRLDYHPNQPTGSCFIVNLPGTNSRAGDPRLTE